MTRLDPKSNQKLIRLPDGVVLPGLQPDGTVILAIDRVYGEALVPR